MRVTYRRSEEWVRAQRIASGANVPEVVTLEIEPATLAQDSRRAILESCRGRYPDALDKLPLGVDLPGIPQQGLLLGPLDLEPAEVTPGHVDQLIAQAWTTRTEREAETLAAKAAREAETLRQKAARKAEIAPVIDAFLADPAARPAAMDSRPRYWVQLGEERIRDADARYRELLAEVERRAKLDEEAAEAQAEAERRTQRDAMTAQIAQWVADRGSESQQQRHAEGLLPQDEVLAEIRRDALASLVGFEQYRRITVAEVHAECEDSPQDDYCEKVEFSSDSALDATAEEYARLVEIRSAVQAVHPEADVTLRTHLGTWDCGNTDHPLHEVTRMGVHVHVLVGAVHATAEYAA